MIDTLLEKLASAKNKKFLTYAIDFDGTIFENKYPKIGKVKPKTADFMRKAYERGDRVIVWTCRSGKGLKEAEKALKENNIPYHEINKNSKFSTGSPKIYADYYIDDKALHIDDLQKIAEYKEEIMEKTAGKEKSEVKPNKALLTALGGLSFFGPQAIISLTKKKSDLTDEQFENIIKDFKDKNNINLKHTNLGDLNEKTIRMSNTSNPLSYKFQKLWAKIKKDEVTAKEMDKKIKEKIFEVKAPKKESILLHELGHVKDFDKRMNKNIIIKAFSNIARVAPGITMLSMTSNKVRDKIREFPGGNNFVNFIEKHPYIASYIAINAIKFKNEGVASAYAVNKLIKKYGLKEGIKKGSDLIPGASTYLLGGLKSTAVTGSIIKTKADKHNNKIASYKEEIMEKTATLKYDPPMNAKDIKTNYPKISRTLLSDPVHRWRADTGIELIHKEPTKEELIRIYKNWILLDKNNKKISDNKSKELFGMNNKQHYKKLINEYKEILEKTAALKSDVNLYPHQKKVVEEEKGSKVIAHPVGSGKTLTAIAKFEKMKELGKANKALVIVPSSLRDNFAEDGLKKFTNSSYNIIGTKQENKAAKKYKAATSNTDYNIISYEMFKKNPEHYIKAIGADTVIIDESHRQKNEDTELLKALKRVRPMYNHHLSLTGSLVSNSIADVQPLIDVTTGGKHKIGENKKEFIDMWAKRSKSSKYKGVAQNRIPIVGFKNEKELKKQLLENVDYLDIEDIRKLAKIPEKDLKLKKIPLSKEQAKIYKKILKDNPEIKKLIRKKRLETLKDEEASKAFSKMIESRKLMNNPASVVPGIKFEEGVKKSPKLQALLNDLSNHLESNPKGRALVFSHLIHGGVDSLEEGLKQRKIEYGKFVGKGNKGVTEETRQSAVRDYNKGKRKVMLISSAGGEGLSLGDTTWEGVLDMHYNPEKMKQMEARGIRSGGQSYLPEEKRKVDVTRYMATMPKFLGLIKSKTRTPDEFIYDISRNKEYQNKLLYDLLKNKTNEFKENKRA